MRLQKNGLPRRCNCSLSMLSLPRCDVPSRLRLRRDCLPTAAKLSPDGPAKMKGNYAGEASGAAG